jgi:hypothetical protein
MMFQWGEYEGRLAGNWRLDSFLGERDHRAFFVGQNEVSNDTALIQLVEQSDPAAAAFRASWDRALGLRHPHLVRVFETGEADFDGDLAAYAAMDLPADDIGEILEKRTLDPGEARAMASGAAAALAYLHERRLAHGAVRPANVFLVNGNIALSVDTLAPAREVDRRRDMRELGVALMQAITGAGDSATLEDPAVRERLSEFASPFRQIIEGCVHREWTPADVLETLAGRQAPPRTLPPAPAAERAARRWPLAAAAVVGAVALLTYAARSGSHSPAEPKAAKQEKKVAIVTRSAPKEAAKPGRAKAAPRVDQPSRPPEPVSQADRRAPQSEARGSWAVIAATYNTFSGAERRAEQIRKKFPKLQPHVFPPKDEGRRYYVVLGSGLTQEAAERLRRLARELGAPRDTYVTKLAES